MRNNDTIINVELVNTEEESVVSYLSCCPDIYLEDFRKVMKHE
jgi:hypothetical protein